VLISLLDQGPQALDLFQEVFEVNLHFLESFREFTVFCLEVVGSLLDNLVEVGANFGVSRGGCKCDTFLESEVLAL